MGGGRGNESEGVRGRGVRRGQRRGVRSSREGEGKEINESLDESAEGVWHGGGGCHSMPWPPATLLHLHSSTGESPDPSHNSPPGRQTPACRAQTACGARGSGARLTGFAV